MRSENTMTESAKDRQLGPLASFVRAAEPLEELTPAERERIRHRLHAAFCPSHRPAAVFRWSTVLAALGLLLAGGAVFAAAGHFGLIPWPREAGPRIISSEQTAGHARRRPARGVAPSTTAPVPVAEPAPSQPAVVPVVGPASSAPATASPRADRATRVTPVKEAPSQTGTAASPNARSTHGEEDRSPRSQVAAITPRSAVEPGLPQPSSVPAVAPEAGPRLALLAPVTANERVARASHVTPAALPTSLNGQAMIAQAMRSLRNDHDPTGALEILTRHAALFPQSPLNSERSVLEVEALLAMGRRDEALLRLDRMSLDNTPRSAERYVVRGELRARAQRWSEAGVDFDQALAHGKGSPVWQERALWGRAATRTHTGDQAGARADLQIYLQLYPTGRFASEAARLLANSR